jgi:rSAM/selenodomain-associated transferase 2
MTELRSTNSTSAPPAALSIIVPVHRDDEALGRLLAQLAPDPRLEVVVSKPPPVGRGAQMNAGAARATGGWLLFLHADSRMPAGWIEAFTRLAADPRLVGAWFRFGLETRAWQGRVIERLVALRVRLWQLPYGDQGLFVRRDVFETLGGFREWPLMEDLEFVRRLGRAGRVAELPLSLATSARRWERDGWFRRSARNLLLVVRYWFGMAPARLARWYGSNS